MVAQGNSAQRIPLDNRVLERGRGGQISHSQGRQGRVQQGGGSGPVRLWLGETQRLGLSDRPTGTQNQQEGQADWDTAHGEIIHFSLAPAIRLC